MIYHDHQRSNNGQLNDDSNAVSGEESEDDPKDSEEIDDLEFEIDEKQYKVTKTDDGGYDVEVMLGKQKIFQKSSKELGNDIKEFLGMFVSGAMEAKKNKPAANKHLSNQTIQSWVDHIGKDLISRENLVYFRSIVQKLNNTPT